MQQMVDLIAEFLTANWLIKTGMMPPLWYRLLNNLRNTGKSNFNALEFFPVRIE
jgi:hypothetical protein